ncbi:HIRAN domain-containing protein [Thalassospira xiamenensis]|uniref:HIRAN domain-containing protein n=1 Tax=Thalassospira xiamenensis TaxID=220697 RepID=UPI000DED5E7E|nr:HIRAN domain-containing protein [Thalassospira xiamenensis]RCK40486.1 hypothetical protein TH24_11185 [Thalassospira xiamenensis]
METLLWAMLIATIFIAVYAAIKLIDRPIPPDSRFVKPTNIPNKHEHHETSLEYELNRLEQNIARSRAIHIPEDEFDEHIRNIDPVPRPEGFHKKWAWNQKVAGTQSYAQNVDTLFDEESPDIIIEREPTNPYDINAIAVFSLINGEKHQLGYLPKPDAARFAAEVPHYVPIAAEVRAIYRKTSNTAAGLRIDIWLPRTNLWNKFKT